jgi:transposase InsO family protein
VDGPESVEAVRFAAQAPFTASEGSSRVTQDDVLFGYRLQLFALASERGVSEACRLMGVHRSTYYRPTSSRRLVEQRIVAFALGHPGLEPRRIAAQLARPHWGGLRISPNGIWKVLCRHGLNTRTKRLALVAGYRAPYEPPREAPPEPHITSTRPGELVGIDCFYVGRPTRHRRHGLANHAAIDTYSSYAWADLVVAANDGPGAEPTSRLVRRVAAELRAAGWRLERVLSDNGNEFRSRVFTDTVDQLDVHHTKIRAGRPQTNGHVERLHRTILEECWRPAFARFLQVRFTGLRDQLASYLHHYTSTAPTPDESRPGDARPNSSKNGAAMSRNRRHIPESVHTRRPRVPPLGAGAARLPNGRPPIRRRRGAIAGRARARSSR